MLPALPCLALLACGGTTGTAGIFPADGGEAPAADSTGDDAGAGVASNDAGRKTSDAGHVSVSGDGGPAPRVDASVPLDLRLDPIEVGHAWTYNVDVIGFYPACENGIGVATTLSKSTLDGKTAFQVQSLCKDAGTYDYAVENDRVFYRSGGKWRLATDEPVQAGHTWTDDSYDYVWEDEGSQVTPAGTFTDCWTARRDLAFPSFTTFCRGVGPVHWHYEDGYGNGYDAILTSKNF
jgi:hypothetical protein